MKKAISAATRHLGYKELRPLQEKVVEHFLAGRDVFVSLPTGSGKSLCYCILPKAFDILRSTMKSIAIIVSPLVSLMKDQVRNMRERDVAAVYVGDCCVKDEADVCAGEYQLVYLSPEALLTNDTWRDMLQSSVYQDNLIAVVVDEAHCVKKW